MEAFNVPKAEAGVSCPWRLFEKELRNVRKEGFICL